MEPYSAVILSKEIPRPRRRLKRGPATQPVIANSPRPILAIARSLMQSPTELPRARIVIARYAVSTPVISPMS